MDQLRGWKTVTLRLFALDKPNLERAQSEPLSAIPRAIAGNLFVLFPALAPLLGSEAIKAWPRKLPRHLLLEIRRLWPSRSIWRWRATSRNGKTPIGIMKRAILMTARKSMLSRLHGA